MSTHSKTLPPLPLSLSGFSLSSPSPSSTRQSIWDMIRETSTGERGAAGRSPRDENRHRAQHQNAVEHQHGAKREKEREVNASAGRSSQSRRKPLPSPLPSPSTPRAHVHPYAASATVSGSGIEDEPRTPRASTSTARTGISAASRREPWTDTQPGTSSHTHVHTPRSAHTGAYTYIYRRIEEGQDEAGDEDGMPPHSARSVRSVPLESELGYYPRSDPSRRGKTGGGAGGAGGNASGSGNGSGAGLTRKKSAQLLNGLGKGLGRMGSVMRRTGAHDTAPRVERSPNVDAANTAPKQPAAAIQKGGPKRSGSVRKTMTYGSWRGKKPPKDLQHDMDALEEEEEEEIPPMTARSAHTPTPAPSAHSRDRDRDRDRDDRSARTGGSGKTRDAKPPILHKPPYGRNHMGEAEGDEDICMPFGVQHELHVSPALDDLPPAWLEALKQNGLSEQDLLLISAARQKTAASLTPRAEQLQRHKHEHAHVDAGQRRDANLTPVPQRKGVQLSDTASVASSSASRNRLPRLTALDDGRPSIEVDGASFATDAVKPVKTSMTGSASENHVPTSLDVFGHPGKVSHAHSSSAPIDFIGSSTRPNGLGSSGHSDRPPVAYRSAITKATRSRESKRLSAQLRGFASLQMGDADSSWADDVLGAMQRDGPIEATQIPATPESITSIASERTGVNEGSAGASASIVSAEGFGLGFSFGASDMISTPRRTGDVTPAMRSPDRSAVTPPASAKSRRAGPVPGASSRTEIVGLPASPRPLASMSTINALSDAATAPERDGADNGETSTSSDAASAVPSSQARSAEHNAARGAESNVVSGRPDVAGAIAAGISGSTEDTRGPVVSARTRPTMTMAMSPVPLHVHSQSVDTSESAEVTTPSNSDGAHTPTVPKYKETFADHAAGSNEALGMGKGSHLAHKPKWDIAPASDPPRSIPFPPHPSHVQTRPMYRAGEGAGTGTAAPGGRSAEVIDDTDADELDTPGSSFAMELPDVHDRFSFGSSDSIFALPPVPSIGPFERRVTLDSLPASCAETEASDVESGDVSASASASARASPLGGTFSLKLDKADVAPLPIPMPGLQPPAHIGDLMAHRAAREVLGVDVTGRLSPGDDGTDVLSPLPGTAPPSASASRSPSYSRRVSGSGSGSVSERHSTASNGGAGANINGSPRSQRHRSYRSSGHGHVHTHARDSVRSCMTNMTSDSEMSSYADLHELGDADEAIVGPNGQGHGNGNGNGTGAGIHMARVTNVGRVGMGRMSVFGVGGGAMGVGLGMAGGAADVRSAPESVARNVHGRGREGDEQDDEKETAAVRGPGERAQI